MVRDYQAENIAVEKCQKVDDGPVALVLAPAVNVNWLPSVTHKAISDV